MSDYSYNLLQGIVIIKQCFKICSRTLGALYEVRELEKTPDFAREEGFVIDSYKTQ